MEQLTRDELGNLGKLPRTPRGRTTPKKRAAPLQDNTPNTAYAVEFRIARVGEWVLLGGNLMYLATGDLVQALRGSVSAVVLGRLEINYASASGNYTIESVITQQGKGNQ